MKRLVFDIAFAAFAAAVLVAYIGAVVATSRIELEPAPPCKREDTTLMPHQIGETMVLIPQIYCAEREVSR